jgi:hypothetical protein
MRIRTQLARELPAVPLHPFILTEGLPCTLPAGTWLEGAAAALEHGKALSLDSVIARVIEPDGWIAMVRVRIEDLRIAVATRYDGGSRSS